MNLMFILDSDYREEISIDADVMIWTNSLLIIDFLKQKNISSFYLYDAPQEVFEEARNIAFQWIESFEERRKYLDISFLKNHSFEWFLTWDALFEIKNGVFDAIWQGSILWNLMKQYQPSKIHVIAKKGNPFVGWVSNLSNHYGASFSSEEISIPSLKKKRSFRWLEIFEDLLICRCLMFFSRRKKYCAIVSVSGNRSISRKDSKGNVVFEDFYYKKIQDLFLKANESFLNICIFKPKTHLSFLKSRFYFYKNIFKGTIRSWHSYASMKDIIYFIRQRKNIRSLIKKDIQEGRLALLFSSDRFSFFTILEDHCLNLVPSLMAASRLNHSIAKNIVKTEGLSSIFSSECFSGLGRSLASAIHEQSGKMFGIQAGIISPTIVTNIGFYALPYQKFPQSMPDRFWVWGSAYQKILESYGLPRERIEIIGFHRSLNLKKDTKQLQNILYLASGNLQVCPYLTTLEEDLCTIAMILKALPKGLRLIVRIHPEHSIDAFSSLMSHDSIDWHHAPKEPLEYSLEQSYCVLGQCTTTLLEACHALKPIILTHFFKRIDFSGFLDDPDAPWVARTPETLKEMLQDLFLSDSSEYEDRLKRFSQRWCEKFSRKNQSKFEERLSHV